MRNVLAVLSGLLMLGLCPAAQADEITIDVPGDQTVQVLDTGLTVRFTGVTDQRCPSDVDCYWEGMIRVELSVARFGGASKPIILCNLCDDGTRDAVTGGQRFSLRGLAPPTEVLDAMGRLPVLADYTVTLAVATE